VTGDDLREEISIEVEQLDLVVSELSSLRSDVAGHEPSLREKTAAAAFLAQFYGGVENIPKRISRFHKVPLPVGDTRHTDCFFASAALPLLPFLNSSTMIWPLSWRRIVNSDISCTTATGFRWTGNGCRKEWPDLTVSSPSSGHD